MKTETKKLSLSEIKVESFVTVLDGKEKETVAGGITQVSLFALQHTEPLENERVIKGETCVINNNYTIG